jgi:hypothetical protein
VVNPRIRPPSAERDLLDQAKVVDRGCKAQLEIIPFRSKALIGHTNTFVALARSENLAERFGVGFFRDKDFITGGILIPTVDHEKEASFAGRASL